MKETLKNFGVNLLRKQKDIETEFVDIVNKHFWELIDSNMTKGEKIIRTDLNKKKQTPVDVFKNQIAEMIDGIEHFDSEFKRKDQTLKEYSIKSLEEASMWITKYLTS